MDSPRSIKEGIFLEGRNASSVRVTDYFRRWRPAAILAVFVLISGGCARRGMTVLSRGTATPPSLNHTIHIQDFRFTKNKSEAALSPPVFKLLEPVRAAFFVKGLTTGSHGEASADLDLTVKDPSGRIMFQLAKLHAYRGKLNKAMEAPVTFVILLPVYAPPGKYEIDFLIHDNRTRASSNFSRMFQLSGQEPPSFKSLTIFNAYFSRKTSGNPLTTPQFAPSGTAWLNFDVGGFQGKDGEQQWLVESLKLTGPKGKIFMNLPMVWQFHDSLGYVPAFLPMTNRLIIPQKAPKGVYACFITFMDRDHHLKVEKKLLFKVK